MSHFYMTLPSNSSAKTYPDNTIAMFTTLLSEPVELSGNWEVGLAEISVPTTWHNVRKNDFWFAIEHGEEKHTITLPEGHYGDARMLLHALFESVKAKLRSAEAAYEDTNEHDATTVTELWRDARTPALLFAFVRDTDRVIFAMPSGFKIAMSVRLQDMLGLHGFRGDQRTHEKRIWKGSAVCDVRMRNPPKPITLFVYCDLIEPVIVGDTKVRLLKTIPFSYPQINDVAHARFEKPIYIPLEKKSFSSVEINIMTDTGTPAPFESGKSTKSIVVLHFRRTTNPYFL